MINKNSILFRKKMNLSKASEEQEKFLNDGTYSIVTPGGKNFERTFELLAHNINSGKILVKERVVYGRELYEKTFVLSREGKTEKYKGSGF